LQKLTFRLEAGMARLLLMNKIKKTAGNARL